MKKLNNWLNTASALKLFIITSIIFAIVIFFILKILDSNNVPITRLSIGSTVMGMLFGVLISGTIDQLRKSDKFWRYAEVVEKLIDEAESKTDLQLIFEREYEKLKKMSGGGAHSFELKRLHTIMQTKYKYIK